MSHPCDRCRFRRWNPPCGHSSCPPAGTSCVRTAARNRVAALVDKRVAGEQGQRLFNRFMAMRVQVIFCEVKNDE